MRSEFLGVGWRFPIGLEGGQIGLAPYEESVRESIWIVLATARGERRMRPDFGCGIHDLVFASPTGETLGRVETEVRNALTRWEPRIELLGVSADRDESEPSRLLLQIDYRVRVTNNRFNLVFPFYLEGAANAVA